MQCSEQGLAHGECSVTAIIRLGQRFSNGDPALELLRLTLVTCCSCKQRGTVFTTGRAASGKLANSGSLYILVPKARLLKDLSCSNVASG